VAERRPKVGLLMLGAKWFWETKMMDQTLVERIKSDVAMIEQALSKDLDLVSSELVTTEEQGRAAAARFAEENVDLLLFCSVIWSEDQPALAVLREVGHLPLVYWCYTPCAKLPSEMTVPDLIRWSGPVGAQQTGGAIRRFNMDLGFVVGSLDDRNVIKEICEYAEAAKLVRDLKNFKIGLLPSHYDVMTNTFVDEFALMSRIGPVVRYVSVAELLSTTNEVKESGLDMFVNELRRRYEVVNISERGMSQAARVSLGLARLVDRLGLDALSISDCNEELHKVLGCRPCLYDGAIREKGVIVGMEGDLLCLTGQIMLSRLMKSPAMFTEIFTFDLAENILLLGHAGMHDPSLAKNDSQIKLTPDYEYPNEESGVWMSFAAREGPVTLLSIVSRQDSFGLVVARGEALPSNNKLQGYPHILVKPGAPVRDFLQTASKAGATQHWAIIHGDAVGKLVKLADFLKLERIIVG